jgi:DNA gyrase subunit A
MEVGMVRRINIDSEMQQSYLDYAMSVIVARALPDARDGLKPVHRRILHAMHSMGIRPTSDFKKSARIVGEVLGKYHPHGDMAVYDAMARMAQDFSMRYPLIDGQGNFGSLDGDPPAAMRYTEARVAPLAMEMLRDLDKETVGFAENFDGSLDEPTVLPAGSPNLLVNGATGIAVGMATSIPPHNMGEVCDALVYMLENWSHLDKITLDDLMGFIHGPDFPTGGIVLRSRDDADELAAAYGTGRGKIVVQARAHVEDMGRGRSRIIVTELPFQTNKSSLIERIADLARAGQLEGLADLRDESDRQGMRIVIELAKTAEPDRVLTELYQRTPMQSTFSMIMLALVDGEPRLLNLRQALKVYLEHRVEVVRRRSAYELARSLERTHILEGLRLALNHLNEVIEMIRGSKDAEQAHQRLRKRFKLSEIQARAILDMPLRRLASLERKKIDDEFKETRKRIKELEALLGSDKKLRGLIAEELLQIKAQFGDRRRTQIVEAKRGRKAQKVFRAGDLVADKETWIVLTSKGHISRSPSARLPRLAGRTAPVLVLGANTRDTMYLFDERGMAVAVAVHTLSECDDPDEGNPVAGATPFPPGVRVVGGITVPKGQVGSQAFLLAATVGGMLKKSPLSALPGPSARPFSAVKVTEPDRLGWVRLTQGDDEICLVSNTGSAIIFSEDDVRPMGLSAAGVLGIRLDEPSARVVAMDITRRGAELLLVTRDGLAKRTPLAQFPRQRRHGKGVLAWKSGEGIELAGGAVGSEEDRFVAHLAKSPDRSMRFADVKRRSRAGTGPAAVALKANDEVTGVTPVVSRVALDVRDEVEQPSEKPEGASRRTHAGARKSGATKAATKRRGSKKAQAKSPGRKRASKSSKRASRKRATRKSPAPKSRSRRSAGTSGRPGSRRKK